MRAIAEFVKTTLIGGLLIVLPVYIAVLLILKAVQGLVTAVKPITAAIPGSVKFEEILAILILAAICFIAGLIVRTRAGAAPLARRRRADRLPFGRIVSPEVAANRGLGLLLLVVFEAVSGWQGALLH